MWVCVIQHVPWFKAWFKHVPNFELHRFMMIQYDPCHVEFLNSWLHQISINLLGLLCLAKWLRINFIYCHPLMVNDLCLSIQFKKTCTKFICHVPSCQRKNKAERNKHILYKIGISERPPSWTHTLSRIMQNHGLAIKLGVQPTEKPYIKRFMQGHDPRYFIERFGSYIKSLCKSVCGVKTSVCKSVCV